MKALLIVTFLLAGCVTTNKLPPPKFTMYGYVTEDGYIYVIEPQSGESIAIKSVHHHDR